LTDTVTPALREEVQGSRIKVKGERRKGKKTEDRTCPPMIYGGAGEREKEQGREWKEIGGIKWVFRRDILAFLTNCNLLQSHLI